MADENEITNSELEAATPKRRAIIPKRDGKAIVETKIRYETNAPETDEDKDKDKTSSSISETQSFDRSRQFETSHNGLSENRLIKLFEDMKEFEDFENEPFMAFITRRQDMMNDSFHRPCSANEVFPPFQIHCGYLTQFIPTIQKHNGNSGGRFDIVITDGRGEDLDISVIGFVIPNPFIEDRTVPNDNGMTAVLSAILDNQKASEQRFEKMLIELTKPKEDTFLELVKAKLQNDFLNPAPPQQSSFNVDEFMAKVLTSQAAAQSISEKFSTIISGNSSGSASDANKGTLQMILDNELIMNRASDLLTNITDIVGDLIAAKQQAAFQQGMTPNPQQQHQATPDQIQAMQAQQQQNDMNLKTIDNILTELESDNPITLENETLKKLASENPALFEQIKGLAQVLKFEVLFSQLETLLPDRFDEFYSDDDELNERGLKVKARLEILYNVLAGKDSQQETDTTTA